MEANDAIPRIAIRNLQRTISVNVAELETFAGNAVQYCLQLQRRKRTHLYNPREVFLCLISYRRMALLHRKFRGQSGPTDVMTSQHREVWISVETVRGRARPVRA